MAASRTTRAALYAGGFLGPFGGGMVVVLVPELRDAFGVSTGLASLALTIYLIPFAALQLVAAALSYLGVTGLGVVVVLQAGDELGLGPTARGLLLAGFGAAGVVAGRPAGRAADRYGPARVAVAGALPCCALLPLLGLAESTATLATGWILAGVCSALIWAGLNTLTVEAAPANRGGAISFVGAFKFVGNALAPLLWLPLYATEPLLAFAGAGASAALVALATTAAQRAQGPVDTGPPTPDSARATTGFGTP